MNPPISLGVNEAKSLNRKFHADTPSLEEKRQKLIQARNLLTEVFNSSKDDWCDDWYCTSLCIILGELDMIINKKLGFPKPKLVGESVTTQK